MAAEYTSGDISVLESAELGSSSKPTKSSGKRCLRRWERVDWGEGSGLRFVSKQLCCTCTLVIY